RVMIEPRLRQVQRGGGLERHRKRGVFTSIRGPGRARRIGEEQEPMKRHLRDRGRRRFRGVEHTGREPRPAEARSVWIRRPITERREEKIVTLATLGRNRRLRFLEQDFERLLLFDR